MKTFFRLLILTAVSISAQNKDTAKADALYKQYEYVDAAQEYLSLVNKGKADNYVYRQLAETYFNMFNTSEAAKWYAKAVEKPQDAEVYYRYAQMLRANGKYAEANKQMQAFAKLSPADQRAVTFLKNPDYVPQLLDQKKLYDVKPTKISSDKSDFGAVLAGNELYFASARNEAKKSYGWNEEPYLDIYKAVRNPDGTFSQPSAVSELNSKYHDGPMTVTADGKTAYFTSDSFRESSFERDKKNNLKLSTNNLFRVVKQGDSWANPSPLPFNSGKYSVGNPSVSRDGKTLYFSSDMPGGIGAVDIWKVSISGDGGYGKPENLGRKVNTEGNESFPFIADDGTTLYFASSGRPGFGGLDVFKVDLSGSDEASNMGKPVNTEKDDFAFSFYKSAKVGFVSSNRGGNDDIYLVNALCAVDLQVAVTDARTGGMLTDASVSILDDAQNVIETEKSNAQGTVSYTIACGKAYGLQVSRNGYESASFPVAASEGDDVRMPAPLQPIDVLVKDGAVALKPIYFEFNKSNVTREGAFELDKLVQVMQQNPKLVILAKSHTDSRGSAEYNLELSEQRARATVQYVISRGIAKERITGKGMGESEPKVNCGENCTEEEHAANRRSEFLIVN